MPICRIFDSTGRELIQCSTDAFLPHSKIFIGRSSRCQICLKALAESSVSRQHLFLLQDENGQWTINDNDSRAGLIQDCKKVTSAPLYEGTILRFGGLFFAFGEKGLPSPYRLTWTDADGLQRYGVLWKGLNSIGASRDNYVTIRQGAVARFHLRILVDGDNLKLKTLHSILETAVNGERVSREQALMANDTISMNGFTVRLEKVETVSKRVGVNLTDEQVVTRNRSRKRVRAMSSVMGLFLLLSGLFFLLGLALMAINWLPGAK